MAETKFFTFSHACIVNFRFAENINSGAYKECTGDLEMVGGASSSLVNTLEYHNSSYRDPLYEDNITLLS